MAMPMRTRLPAAGLAGIVRRARSVLSSQSNSAGLPAARNGPTGLRASCRTTSPGLRGGELHGQDAVFEFDGEQLGGGVDNVFGAGKIRAFAAQAIRADRDAERQPQRIARREP